MPRKDAREAPASIDTSQPADTGLVSPPPPVAAAAGAPAASRNSSTPVSASAAAAAAVAAGSLATDPAPTVHVNKAHLAEIKTSLDDIVKQALVDQAFTPSRLHPTVHLGLGYASVLISLGAMLYSFRMSFEESKPYLWCAVISYGVFQGALWAWKHWVECGEVFRGRRRRILNRIETDLIQIHTSTSLLPPPEPVLSVGPDSRPNSPTATASPLSSPSLTPVTSNSSILGPPASRPHARGPTYLVHLTLATTSNNGKSLIHKARVVSGKSVGEVVDDDGGVEQGEVARWIAGLLGDAGLVEVEDDDAGFKQE